MKIAVKFVFYICGMIAAAGLPQCAAAQQSPQDTFLSQKVGEFSMEHIDRLSEVAGLGKLDRMLLSLIMIDASGNGIDIRELTYRNLLDSIGNRRHAMNGMLVARHHHGKDSVFIRMPDGSRMFLGLGAMSMEALEIRAASGLPASYQGNQNTVISSGEAGEQLSELLSAEGQSWMTGTVMILEKERGTLGSRRIGDIMEIAKRLLGAPELAPFIADLSAKEE